MIFVINRLVTLFLVLQIAPGDMNFVPHYFLKFI